MDKIPVRHINKIKARSQIRVRKLSDVLNGNDLYGDLHRHDFYFLLFIKKGSGFHHIDFKAYDILDSSFFVLKPGQIHQLHLRADSEGYIIQFGQNYYKPTDPYTLQALQFCAKTNFFELSKADYATILGYCSSIHNESLIQDGGRLQSTLALLDLLFIFLYRGFTSKGSKTNSSKTYYQKQLDTLLVVIETHFKEMKQVSDYASFMNQTPYQLNKITKTTLGKTFSEVIADSIILEAKRYIMGTSNQIKEIAYHLGYDDASYFIRFFRTHTGKTPEEFRRSK